MSGAARCAARLAEYGEYLVQQIMNTLVSNPDVWAQTVLLVIYDENGGFFDHVPPVTAPATSLGDTTGAEEAVLNALAGTLDVGIPYPLPASNSMPSQATTPDGRQFRDESL